MKTPTPSHYPKNKDVLLRDFTVAAHLKDIRDAAELQDRLAPKWWETIIGLLQFAAALGLLASILVGFPTFRSDDAGRLLVFWLALMVLSVVLGFEFVIFRLHHLRRANQISLRLIEQLRGRVDALEHSGASGARPAPPKEGDPS